MTAKRKHDKKGRSKGTLGSFVAVERYMMQTVAYRSLSPNARAAYLEVYFGFDGDNNGRILLSAQMLADRLNRDKSTAARALKELERLGFIECMSKGGFNCKIPHASEWRLTAFKCNVTGELPTKQFMRWTPENLERGGTGEADGGTDATDSLKTTRNSPSQWHGCNREAHFEGVSGGTGATHLDYNHTGAESHTAVIAQFHTANQRAGVTASTTDARPMMLPDSMPDHPSPFDPNNFMKPLSAIIGSDGNMLGMVFELAKSKAIPQQAAKAA